MRPHISVVLTLRRLVTCCLTPPRSWERSMCFMLSPHSILWNQNNDLLALSRQRLETWGLSAQTCEPENKGMHACTYNADMRACSCAQTDNMECSLFFLSFFFNFLASTLKKTWRHKCTHPCMQLHQYQTRTHTNTHIFRPYSSAHYGQLHLPCCVQICLWLEYVD